MTRTNLRITALLLSLCSGLTATRAQTQTAPQVYGPFNAVFIPGGTGLVKKALPSGPFSTRGSPWSMFCWCEAQGQCAQIP
ncbi:MAG: hypothetical protein JWP08_3115 [Bryobacterales bacterium]|nr:hypothetical protein [Bryobacterales bacterium]